MVDGPTAVSTPHLITQPHSVGLVFSLLRVRSQTTFDKNEPLWLVLSLIFLDEVVKV